MKNTVISYNEFVPKTLRELHKLDEGSGAELDRLARQKPVIKSPNEDPLQILEDRRDLYSYCSDRVSLRDPLALGRQPNCAFIVTANLIKQSVGGFATPMIRAAENAWKTFALDTIAENARNPKHIANLADDLSEKTPLHTVERKLSRTIPPSRPQMFEHDMDEIYFMSQAASAATNNPQQKKAANLIVNNSFTSPLPSDGFVDIRHLLEQGSTILILTSEGNALDCAEHIDLIHSVDYEGQVSTLLGGIRSTQDSTEKTLKRAVYGMPSLIEIVPDGVAKADKKEIRIRAKLQQLPRDPEL